MSNHKPTIQDFFTRANRVSQISEADYEQVRAIIQTAKAVARSISQSVYIIDYFMRDFLWVSDSLALLCGETPEKIRKGGYNLYIEHVPEEEQRMLLEINDKGFELFNQIPKDERTDYTISYDFHIAVAAPDAPARAARKLTLINHKLTPLLMTPDGRIHLALCTVAPSAYQTPGHIIMRKSGGKTHYEYNLQNHLWEQRPEITLNPLETSILKLSSQGLSMQEIADRTCRSYEAIKSAKRRMFARLGVSTTTEAIAFAANYHIL